MMIKTAEAQKETLEGLIALCKKTLEEMDG